MNLTFANGTAQQKAWARRVVAESRFPWSRVAMNVTVQWVADPDPEGKHRDYAITNTTGAASTILMRSDLGDSNADYALFSDTLHHELGHAFIDGLLTNPQASLSPLFFQGLPLIGEAVVGSRVREGAAADWWPGSPSSPDQVAWEERIIEAVAETFKDTFAAHRKWSNRTHWQLPAKNLKAWLTALAGGGTQTTYDFSGGPAGTFGPNDAIEWQFGFPAGASPDTYQGGFSSTGNWQEFSLAGTHGDVTLTADFDVDYPGPPIATGGPGGEYGPLWMPPTLDPAGNPKGTWGLGWAPWGVPELDVWCAVYTEGSPDIFQRYEYGFNASLGPDEFVLWRSGMWWEVDVWFNNSAGATIARQTIGPVTNQDIRNGTGSVNLSATLTPPAGAVTLGVQKKLVLAADCSALAFPSFGPTVNAADAPKRDIHIALQTGIALTLDAPYPYPPPSLSLTLAGQGAREFERKVVGGQTAADARLVASKIGQG